MICLKEKAGIKSRLCLCTTVSNAPFRMATNLVLVTLCEEDSVPKQSPKIISKETRFDKFVILRDEDLSQRLWRRDQDSLGIKHVAEAD